MCEIEEAIVVKCGKLSKTLKTLLGTYPKLKYVLLDTASYEQLKQSLGLRWSETFLGPTGSMSVLAVNSEQELIEFALEDSDVASKFEKINKRLKSAEAALEHCIESTGGYTGGAPQKHLEKFSKP